MFRLTWWVPATVIVAIGFVTLDGGFGKGMLDSRAMDAVVIGLALFACAACIIAYRRQRT